MAVIAAGCVLPPPAVSPYGRPTMAHARTFRVDGELVAVAADTVWVLTRRGAVLMPVSTDRLVRLDVQRHLMGVGRTFKIMGSVGAGTGVLLTAACSSVEGASCGTVLPGTALAFLAVGAVLSISSFNSAWMRFSPGQVGVARAYSRFPQGLPDTLRTLRRTGQ